MGRGGARERKVNGYLDWWCH